MASGKSVDRNSVTGSTIAADSNESFIADCRRLYRTTLLDGVVPFWLRHGWDRRYGGIGNILDDEGNTVGHDKYLWSQGRALWTFSALYRRIEQRPEWLAFADHTYKYLSTHGRDERGRWMYRLDKDGNVVDRDVSIYADGFAMAGLAEYYAATGNKDALKLALETHANTLERLRAPGSYQVMPYEIPPGLKTHGVAMIYALFYFNLGEIAGRRDICQDGLQLSYEILNDFYVPEKDAILEFVSLDGHFVDSPAGRACVPGHVLESMWFLISIFERSGDKNSIQTCCNLIKRHLELGWDEEWGGLTLARDIDGKEPVYWQHADCKPWWVQVEALVATAYAYLYTRADWCLTWHRKIRDFAFGHYPVPSGEWTVWVDRQGRKMQNPVMPVKDPFHLPRGLMQLIEVSGRL